MSALKGLAWIVLAFVPIPALRAEAHCPGNVASVPLHLVNGYQIIVSVSIDNSVPFDFLLDTGAQFTMIDPTLADELRLRANGSVPVVGNGFRTKSSAVELDRLDVGGHAVFHLEALEFDMQNIRPRYLSLRGILGEDFLQQFDTLIDNGHRLLCLDDSDVLRTKPNGPHIPLQTTSDSTRMPQNSLILAVRLADSGKRIRLKLDSGANAPVLYNASWFKPIDLIDMNGTLQGTGANGSQNAYVALPPQDVEIESMHLHNVPFFAPTKDISNTLDFDGLLPITRFRRVFICHTEHFVVLETY